MQSLKSTVESLGSGDTMQSAVPSPDAVQAAAYIQDLTLSLRRLAMRHNHVVLAMLLEMASIQAASHVKPHGKET
jgi:hypothetical protein